MFQFGFNNPISANDPSGLRVVYTLQGPEEVRGLAEFISDREARERNQGQHYNWGTGRYENGRGQELGWASVHNSLAAQGLLKVGKFAIHTSRSNSTGANYGPNEAGSSSEQQGQSGSFYIIASNESVQNFGIFNLSTLERIKGLNDGDGFLYDGEKYETKPELYLAILVDQTAEQFGIKDIIALAAAIDNLGFVKKPFQMKGASRGTSYASKYGSKLLPQKMPIRLPTHINKAGKVAFTRVLGRFIGRALGPIGWAILAYDVGMTFYNTQIIYNKITEND